MSLDWSSLLGLGANAATGGLLGLLGSCATGIVGIFQARTQFEHEEKMADFELKRITLNTEAARQLAADQLNALVEKNSGDAFTASQIAGNSFNNIPGWASGILSLFRPALTAFSAWLVLYCYTHDVDLESRRAIVASALALNGMAWGWWFGDRQISKMSASRFLQNK